MGSNKDGNYSLPDSQTNEEAQKVTKIKLRTTDGFVLEFDSDVAFKSNTIKELANNPESTSDGTIQLHEVNGIVLMKIMTYCTKTRHEQFVKKAETEDQRTFLSDWEKTYLNVDGEELQAMLMAADFLKIPGLVDIICQKIADMGIGKSVEELRVIYGLENDFTKEEEEEMRKEGEWREQ